MAGVITVGGLATGLDTNEIIDNLVALERRPIALLQRQIAALGETRTALDTLTGKLAALRTAADGLRTADRVLVRRATSSDETVATATAGTGAQRGATTLTVTRLAHGSVAGATVGVSSATATVASGAGTFAFRVGSGDVHAVDVDATTTLQGLADAINGTNGGVRASVVNLGTAATPDYRLQLASTASIVRSADSATSGADMPSTPSA